VIVGVNKRIEGHRPSSSPPMVRIVRGNPGRVVRVVNVRVSSEDGQRALEELKAELEGTSDVESVAMYEDGGRREGLIMAGYRTGVLRVWGFNPANHAEWEEIAEGMWVEEVARAAPEKHWRNTITGERVRRRPSTGALKLKAELRDAHSGRIDSIDFSPDGMRVVSGSDDGTIRLWDSVTLQRLSEKGKAHSQAICSVVFSPDGTKIASGAYDRTIRVWDAVTLELQSEKQGAHRKHIRSVDFSPDGTRMVSGADDRAIRVWESGASMPPPFPTPRPPRAVPTPQSSSSVQCVGPANTATLELAAEATDAHIEIGGESINAVQFSPDGANIVSAGVDDTIKIWDFSPGGAAPMPSIRKPASPQARKSASLKTPFILSSSRALRLSYSHACPHVAAVLPYSHFCHLVCLYDSSLWSQGD